MPPPFRLPGHRRRRRLPRLPLAVALPEQTAAPGPCNAAAGEDRRASPCRATTGADRRAYPCRASAGADRRAYPCLTTDVPSPCPPP
nr:unnamed protein product [Digitaria exilis]